jgi:hypothetical protein
LTSSLARIPSPLLSGMCKEMSRAKASKQVVNRSIAIIVTNYCLFSRISLQGNPISLDKVLFAVKTCGKYHKERMPFLLRTWARLTIHLRVFSDVLDDAIPTIPTGVANAERGHCEKSLRILRMVLDEIQRNSTLKRVEFVVLADDDTLLR